MPIGNNVPRVDGFGKLSGHARYVDDLAIPGVLHGGTIRSPAARGRIKRIRFDPAINWDEFVVVDHRDIPGPNAVKLIETDQPALAAHEFKHKHEPIVLLAHRSIHKLREALRAVRVEFEPLPAVLDPRRSLTPDLIQYAGDNVFKRIDIRKGSADVSPAAFERVFEQAAHVVEGQYHTGAQEHVYIEPQGMLACREGQRLVVMGSMQCPFYVLDALTHLFGRPREAFRVVQTPIGGGFGGKEDFPSNLAIHTALLAEKGGAPVKFIYDRQEDMAVTTKRHPSWVQHRTALDRDGRLLAMQIDVLLDGGAYVTLSPVVLSRGTIHAAGPYHCENIHIHGEARLTNSVPYGAFRGFGAPQTLFAVERHMNEVARRIGMDPIALRKRNLLRDGQTTATGQVFSDGTDLVGLLDQALELGRYEERKREHTRLNASHPYLRRGVGVSCFYHGAGFTGAGESVLASKVLVEGLPDGTVEVLTAQTDMGQGTTTILTQIAADALGVPESCVRVAEPDTSRVPNSGPTVASRTAMVVGHLVEEACDDLIRKATQGAKGSAGVPARGRGPSLAPAAGTSEPEARARASPAKETAAHQEAGSATGDEIQAAIRAWHAANPGQRLLGRGKYTKPPEIQWDEQHYRGNAYACYSWAAYLAEVEIDLRTFCVRVTDFVALQEIGRVLNPTLARGQIAGGVAQGVGWALYENVALDDGVMANAQMTNYIIPTSADLPPIRVYFDERPSRYGPKGAKGIGELPMDGPAPAIVNAVCTALDVSVRDIPLTPERLMEYVESDEATKRRSDAGRAAGGL